MVARRRAGTGRSDKRIFSQSVAESSAATWWCTGYPFFCFFNPICTPNGILVFSLFILVSIRGIGCFRRREPGKKGGKVSGLSLLSSLLPPLSLYLPFTHPRRRWCAVFLLQHFLVRYPLLYRRRDEEPACMKKRGEGVLGKTKGKRSWEKAHVHTREMQSKEEDLK